MTKLQPVQADTMTAMERRNRRVGTWCAGLTLGMLGLAYAAVPLYAMFCQATGYAGTTQRVVKASEVVLDRKVQIRFDGNVGGHLPWRFEPVVRTMDIRVGENALAFFRATNTSNMTVSGTAAYNVDPPIAGAYFNKIACFCFTEQTLAPGETVEMPVSFFIDPAVAANPDAAKLDVIVLSYTFFPVAAPKAAVATQTLPPVGGKGS